jgi:hypothetical protein
MMPEEEAILDASLSFVSGLRYGVFKGDGPLTSNRKMALKNWLDLLSVSLPPEWGLHRLIDDLRRQINYVAESEKHLESVLRAHPMPRQVWSKSCTGNGKWGGVGFSCGFWKLLHIATVGVAEHRGGLNLLQSGMIDSNHNTFSPIEAADTIKDYIALFFNCDECKRNFVEHYNNCDNNRRCSRLTDEDSTATIADWKELALWMWEVHNEVSVRIVSERRDKQLKHVSATNRVSATTESDIVAKQNEVMVIWPTIGECLKCFEADGTWDEPEVFTMLEKTYWPDSEIDPKSDRLLRFEGESTSTLGSLWIVMFVVLYVVYSAIGSKSGAIQRSVLAARRLVAEATKSAGGGVVHVKNRSA